MQEQLTSCTVHCAGVGSTGVRSVEAARTDLTRGKEVPATQAPVDSTAQLGLWIFLATVTMLFAAFSSAYIVQGARPDWQHTPLPGLLWVNTALLLCSSVTLEVGRSRSRRLGVPALRVWLPPTMLLGSAFVIGQLLVWRRLVAEGIYLQTNPHSSFFYILTGLHGLHLFGGILLLSYLCWRVVRGPVTGSGVAQVTDVSATYWHFLAVLWLYLFIMLSVS